jgi:hypothetical protein
VSKSWPKFVTGRRTADSAGAVSALIEKRACRAAPSPTGWKDPALEARGTRSRDGVWAGLQGG